MANETKIFYKPLCRLVGDCSLETNKENSITNNNSNMHIVPMACDEPAKLSKSPRLKVTSNINLITFIQFDYRNKRNVY